MLKTYDSTLQAWTEHPTKNYNSSQSAWVESPSLKTYDATEAAWVEQLYQGYFTLQQATLSADDEFTVTNGTVTLFTAKKAEMRHVILELPLKWAGETVEFNLTKNAIASVGIGFSYKYGQWTNSGSAQQPVISAFDGTYSVTLGTCPDEYEGLTVTDSKIKIDIYITDVNGGNDMGYVNISNLKINGKKYGFKEV